MGKKSPIKNVTVVACAWVYVFVCVWGGGSCYKETNEQRKNLENLKFLI